MSAPRLALFLYCIALTAPGTANDDHVSGRYEGRIGNTSASLDWRASSGNVTGRIIRADGNNIELSGEWSQDKVLGTATSRHGAGFFEAYREFGALVIIIEETGPVTGQPSAVRAEFFPATQAPDTAGGKQTEQQRDAKLVGTWSARGLAHRGDMVLPVISYMTLHTDGSYALTSEPDIESRSGQWRSRAGVLEYRPGDTQGWSPIGAYRLRGDTLITIEPSSEPRVWTRSNPVRK